MDITTPTVKHICGHERQYDRAATPPLLLAGLLSRLAEKACVSCRRGEYAKRRGVETNLSSLLTQVAVETALSECEAWERQEGMPTLEGTQWAVAAGSRVRLTVMSEANDWCADREWTEEEFSERLVVPARQRLDAAWWIRHYDRAPWDLEVTLTRVDDACDLDDDARGVR
ncbi:MAG: hypothetical protein HKL85_13420 [Acidimicrobiaceae bacterium]|nr:hypothetical protein [Acidimicrobiaceae bacterium]